MIIFAFFWNSTKMTLHQGKNPQKYRKLDKISEHTWDINNVLEAENIVTYLDKQRQMKAVCLKRRKQESRQVMLQNINVSGFGGVSYFWRMDNQ